MCVCGGVQAQLTSEAAAVATEIARLSTELPAYVWLVALPQLISRATHSHARTAEATRKIITSVFLHYPDQVSQFVPVIRNFRARLIRRL